MQKNTGSIMETTTIEIPKKILDGVAKHFLALSAQKQVLHGEDLADLKDMSIYFIDYIKENSIQLKPFETKAAKDLAEILKTAGAIVTKDEYNRYSCNLINISPEAAQKILSDNFFFTKGYPLNTPEKDYRSELYPRVSLKFDSSYGHISFVGHD